MGRCCFYAVGTLSLLLLVTSITLLVARVFQKAVDQTIEKVRRGGLCVCVCARARASSGIGGTLPAHPPTAESCAGWICTPYNPSPEARALLSSLSSWAGWVRVKEGWRGIILFLLE